MSHYCFCYATMQWCFGCPNFFDGLKTERNPQNVGKTYIFWQFLVHYDLQARYFSPVMLQERSGTSPELSKNFQRFSPSKTFCKSSKKWYFSENFSSKFQNRAILSSGLKVMSYSSPSFDEREVAAKAEKKLASFSSVDFPLSIISTDLSIYYWLLAAKIYFAVVFLAAEFYKLFAKHLSDFVFFRRVCYSFFDWSLIKHYSAYRMSLSIKNTTIKQTSVSPKRRFGKFFFLFGKFLSGFKTETFRELRNLLWWHCYRRLYYLCNSVGPSFQTLLLQT